MTVHETGTGRLGWLAVAAVWLVASFGTGAALAWLHARVYRGLSFYRLWAFWTVVASFAVVAVFLAGMI